MAHDAHHIHHHDHTHCVHTALREAEALCDKRGLRLTPLRREVLQLVWQTHGPVKAYDLLSAMNQNLAAGERQAAPPTVYRALEFLLDAGLIHRLDTLNAFIGCGDPGHAHYGQFLVCRQCHTVSELNEPAITHALQTKASSLGFSVDKHTLEIQGLCRQCRE